MDPADQPGEGEAAVASGPASVISGAQAAQVGTGNVQLNLHLGTVAGLAQPGHRSGLPTARPIAEVTDPFGLEVHRAVSAPPGLPELPPLPWYVPRALDQLLAVKVEAAIGGHSRIAVLVGGSSTGKTRACWEALQPLRHQLESWHLWHPIHPSRPEAVLRELSEVGPRTIIWLNDAHFYLGIQAAGWGEQVAAGLRDLMRGPARGPVLILATLWPEQWNELTLRPPAGFADAHSQARELLTGQDISVPEAFTPAERRNAAASGDPRLVQAAAAATDGRVVQFLAGAPELLNRYRNAPAAARALINAAIDARRLGMSIELPWDFLAEAAPGYLTDPEWGQLGEQGLSDALAYVAARGKGALGPLTPVRPRPARDRGPDPARVTCRLADYLEEHGRQERRDVVPPGDFWTAATRHAGLADLPSLAVAAEERGLLSDAACLRKRAAASGDAREAAALVRQWHAMHAGLAGLQVAAWAAGHAAVDSPVGVVRLLRALRAARATGPAGAFAQRVADDFPAGESAAIAEPLFELRAGGWHEQAALLVARAAVSLDPGNPVAVARFLGLVAPGEVGAEVMALASRASAVTAVADLDLDVITTLLGALRHVSAREQARELAGRAAAHACVGDPDKVAALMTALQASQAGPEAIVLAGRACEGMALGDPHAVAFFVSACQDAKASAVAVGLARRAAEGCPLRDPAAVARLLSALSGVDSPEPTRALIGRAPAARVDLVNPVAVAELLGALREAGASAQVAVLAGRASARAPVADPVAAARLLGALRDAGASAQVAELATRAGADAFINDPYNVALLLGVLRDVRAADPARELAGRAASEFSLSNSYALARMVDALREARSGESARALAVRAAAHAPLDAPNAAARLLGALRDAEASEAATVLAIRASADASLAGPVDVARLLGALRDAGAEAEVAVLAARAAAGVALDDPYGVARLLGAIGAGEEVAALAARAAGAALDDPYAVASLLEAMREAGAGEEATVLAGRAAARANLDDPQAASALLDVLRARGATEEVATLAGRLPAGGQFRLFCEQVDQQGRYQFGRAADGAPAQPWTWDSLG